MTPLEVFYSYADEDEALIDTLERHLSVLLREGLITLWHKRLIPPGSDAKEVLDFHLKRASIILLLISPDFVYSDYCYGTEMQLAMQRHKTNGARVIPILLRPVDYQGTLFDTLKSLPSNGMPITIWDNQDAAFTDVIKGIRAALEDIQHATTSTPPVIFPHVWNIPYPRNPVFTGREEVLLLLADTLKANQPMALAQPQAISGLGGIGKTQIAIEYAYRLYHRYQVVLWTRADTHEALVSGYAAIAELLNLPEQYKPDRLNLLEKDKLDQMVTVRAVIRWLTTHTKWLLILDNADDLVLVHEFLPSRFDGHILLTTRAQAIGRLARLIEINTMELDSGTLLLLRRAGLVKQNAPLEDASSFDIATARNIVEELGGLPLALDQAGAYIETTPSSLTEYLQLYRTNRSRLLNKRGDFLTDHPDSVATTWSLAFAKATQKSSAAADLLRLCAFLHPDAIPEEIITQGAASFGQSFQFLARDAIAFNEAIEALSSYSLIRRNPNTKTLTIHRLVQAVLKDAMSQTEYRRWAIRVIRAFDRACSPAELPEAMAYGERYISHAQACTMLISQEKMGFSEAVRILFYTGRSLTELIQYKEAEMLFERVLSICEQQGEPYQLIKGTSLSALAEVYYRQNRYSEAEQTLEQVLVIWESQEEQTTVSKASSINLLAMIYMEQGKYKEAEQALQQALAIYKKQVGQNHPLTASCFSYLAELYTRMGKYGKAEPLLQQALAIHKKQASQEDPRILITMGSFAHLYILEGKFREAEALLQESLVVLEPLTKPWHSQKVAMLDHLARLYSKQAKYKDAEPLLQQALAICEQMFGPDDPQTGNMLNDLALLYTEWGKDLPPEDAEPLYRQAEMLYLRALTIEEQQQKSTHSGKALILNNLGLLYANQGKDAKAEPFYQQALNIRQQKLGPDHPSTAQTLNNLAGVYMRRGWYDKAEQFYRQALTIWEQQGDYDMVKGMENLATLYVLQQKYESAKPLLQKALEIRELQLGPQDPTTIQMQWIFATLFPQAKKPLIKQEKGKSRKRSK